MRSPWRPAHPEEQQLQAARDADDVPAFLITLARSELLLVYPDEPGKSWAVSRIGDRLCLIAFTSRAALDAAHQSHLPCRAVRFPELAATWPDPAWYLAVNPGLPLETFLDRASVQDVAALSAAPATELETRLRAALDAGDVERYVSLLLLEDVMLPLPEGDGVILDPDLNDPDFPWFRIRAGDGPDEHIVIFSSAERWQDVAGLRPAVLISFAEVAHAWPDESALMVDPGQPHGGLVDGAVMQHVRRQLREGVQE